MTQRPTVLPARGGADAVTLQNTPFFCTGQDGVPQENAAVSRKYIQSVPLFIQNEETDSVGWVHWGVWCTKTGIPRTVYSGWM